MKTYPADFSPPENARYFSVRITRDDGRHELSVGLLSAEELDWVARVIAAELALRYEREERKVTMPVPRRLNNDTT